jgi:hypothetical protein
MLDQATFTMNASVCFGNTSHTGTQATGFATPIPDYTGNVFAITTLGAGGTSSVTNAAFKFNSNTGAIIAYNNSTTPGAGQAIYPGTAWYYDYITNRLWGFALNSAGTDTTFVTEHWTGNLTQINSASSTQGGMTASAATSFLGRQGFNNADYRGDLSIIPFRGIFLLGMKCPGMATGPYAFPFSAWSLIPPSGTGTNAIGTTVPLNIAVGYATNATNYQLGLSYNINLINGGLTTDCNRIFGSYNVNNNISGLYNAVYCITGLYGVVNTQASANSRLLLRG